MVSPSLHDPLPPPRGGAAASGDRDLGTPTKGGEMIVKARPLLCELHAHTTWSDGAYELSELVDLYGSQGFDVLVVTDHALCSDDPWLGEHPNGARVDAGNHAAYLEAVEAEAERAPAPYAPLP